MLPSMLLRHLRRPASAGLSRRRRLLATLAVALPLMATPAVASAGTIGIVPPANPSANCVPPAADSDALAKIDFCRASEGIGPMTLPSNFSGLSVEAQQLVVFDLERTARGLAPIIGLNSNLDSLSQAAAMADNDPSFPSSGILGGGSIWAAAPSTLDADYEWMYDDGIGSGNLDCSAAKSSGCWAHRDNILINEGNQPLIAGAGYVAGGWTDGANSYAAEMDYIPSSGSHFSPDVFSWAGELGSFSSAPTKEPLNPSAASSTPTPAPTPSATAPVRIRLTLRATDSRSAAIAVTVRSGGHLRSAVARGEHRRIVLHRSASGHGFGGRLGRGVWRITLRGQSADGASFTRTLRVTVR